MHTRTHAHTHTHKKRIITCKKPTTDLEKAYVYDTLQLLLGLKRGVLGKSVHYWLVLGDLCPQESLSDGVASVCICLHFTGYICVRVESQSLLRTPAFCIDNGLPFRYLVRVLGSVVATYQLCLQ
jgi:hypothetical protein